MSEPNIDVGIAFDRPSGDIIVSVDINGSAWFDGSGPTLEAAVLEALVSAASYAFRAEGRDTDRD